MKYWTAHDVAHFLDASELNLKELKPCFSRRNITGPVLLGLNDSTLRELGVTSNLTRRKLLAEIRREQAALTPSALASSSSSLPSRLSKNHVDDDDDDECYGFQSMAIPVHRTDRSTVVMIILGVIATVMIAAALFSQRVYTMRYQPAPASIFDLLAGADFVLDVNDINAKSKDHCYSPAAI